MFSKQSRFVSVFRMTFACFVASHGFSCGEAYKESGSAEAEWLRGTTDEKFHTVARQLRGFDMAMVETGHRYTELYWAGRDTNWIYAGYQLEKIRVAIQNGLERRPKRAASAETFLTMVLPEVEKAVHTRDRDLFWNRFGALTSACNACHIAEKMEFVVVGPPEVRNSPVQTLSPGIEE